MLPFLERIHSNHFLDDRVVQVESVHPALGTSNWERFLALFRIIQLGVDVQAHAWCAEDMRAGTVEGYGVRHLGG